MSREDKTQPFEVEGSEVLCQSAEDLLRLFGEIDTTVPSRATKSRKPYHRERFCIVRYLSTLAAASRLQFPLRIVKSESPDFLLFSPNELVGLEITEAGTRKGQEALTRLSKSPPGTLLEGEAGLRPPGKPLRGRGYAGDEAERELCDLVMQAFEKKTTTLNKAHFQTADRYELLIYDNSHVGLMAEMEDLAPLLKTAFSSWCPEIQPQRRFSLISLLRDSRVLYDCTGDASILNIQR